MLKIVYTVYKFGNTTTEKAAQNSIRLIKLANPGYEVPVVAGAGKPMKRDWRGPVCHIHGDNGIGNAQIEASDQKVLDEDYRDFIYRIAEECNGELVLVTLGRMTNIALALEKYPDLPAKVKRLVMMGGTVYAPGNVTPCSEANIFGDPEAADIVFMSGFDITMVGLDVTTKTRLTMDHISRLEHHCREENQDIVKYMRTALSFYMNFYRIQEKSIENCPVHDPLAMLAALHPELVKVQRMKARVECQGTYCTGKIVTDLRPDSFDANYINMCLEVDGIKAVDELLSVFC
jgi:purine nucleosidase